MQVDLLIVDDEVSLRDLLSTVFEEDGCRVETAATLADGRAALQKDEPDLVLCDLMLPDGSGLELLRETKAQNPSIAVIMITAHTSTKSAVEALKAGAFDYIAKPFDIEELKIIVRKAVERKELEDENLHLRTALEEKFTFANIIGRSTRMQEIFSIVQRIAKTMSTVLISGESGTGKELIARAIHYNSSRRGKFVSINCGALPENLLESELFGHERGAFTGAIREKRGLFQEADRGTIFLDEIGETSTAMQIKLLRVLQDRLVRKVGSNTETQVDVRVIAATNRDLNESITHQRHPDRVAGPAAAQGRHSAAGRALRLQVLRKPRSPAEEDFDRRDARNREVSLARKRARARKRRRADDRARDIRSADHQVPPRSGAAWRKHSGCDFRSAARRHLPARPSRSDRKNLHDEGPRTQRRRADAGRRAAAHVVPIVPLLREEIRSHPQGGEAGGYRRGGE
ncbi:MAG: hypothetical protein DMF59_01330 [Acidobacteria bacterium]|nr:MAG: hypothetical protein DMF59_01330 [Acidobacteriota bacterium]